MILIKIPNCQGILEMYINLDVLLLKIMKFLALSLLELMLV